MKPITRACVIILTSWALVVQSDPECGTSTNILDVIYLLSGDFDNSAQKRSSGTDYDYIQYTGIPVNISDKLPGHVLYTEWSFNGAILNMQFNEFRVDKQGVVYLIMHNITDKDKYKPGVIRPEDLHNLKIKQNPNQRECLGSFQRISKGVYTGNWPECRISIRGHHPPYADTLSCEAVRVSVPVTAKEQYYRLPYDLRLTGPRYPLIGYPPSYKPPC